MMAIPCFYFPTTVVFVDDNRSFLENLPLNLDPALLYKLHRYPEAALADLQFQSPQLTMNIEFTQRLQASGEEEEGVCIEINFNSIRNLALDAQRFSYYTVLVIDYAMPTLTGFEFCKRVQSLPVKKILLTGEAGPDLAVTAFNEGIIDQFIVKAAPDMQTHLENCIRSAQWDFFLQQSENVISILSKHHECALFEPKYQAFIRNYFISHFPCEFYLLDSTGSFLFISAEGETTLIIIKSERELQNYYAIASDYSRAYPLPDQVLDDLKQYRRMPFLFSEYQHTLAVSAWKNYLHPTQMLSGVSRYFYAVIPGSKDYFHTINLHSFSKYSQLLV
jgi:CheY-like chemotaxis protein